MLNAASVKEELKNYITARTPLVIINTNERERVERILREITDESGTEIWYYTDARQVRVFGRRSSGDQAFLDAKNDPLSFFLDKMKKGRNITAVLGDVRKISEENIYSHQLMNLLYTARETNGTVILVTGDAVWARISSFGMMITLELPDTEERIRQIEAFIAKYKGRFEVEWDKRDILKAAAVLRGFSEVQIENILSAEIVSMETLKKERISRLGSQKQKLYGQMDSVKYIQTPERIASAGMENLKEWLEDRKNVFFAPEELLKKYDLKAPKGILLVGVPGCGKSLTAKMVASEWGLPLFRFDIGSVYNKWVGESEKKMREALQFIDNVSPCVLWIDEIEKVLAATDSGNETGKRVLGEFLFWIQETDSKVFMVATANNVTLLPYELYRKGRFSEIFFTDLPQSRERAAAFRQYISRSLHQEVPAGLLTELVELSEGFSYADIEITVKNVAQDMLNEDLKNEAAVHGELIQDRLIREVGDIIPISRSNPEIVERIRQWGRERARNVSLPATTAIVEPG